VDVRILAATNINIPEALANKSLREDLYYRLNAFTLSLPPLRERKEEVPILLKHFMSRHVGALWSSSASAFAVSHGSVPGALLARESARAQQFCKALFDPGRRKAGVSELNPKGDFGTAGASQGDEEGGPSRWDAMPKTKPKPTPLPRLSIRPTGTANRRRPC